MGITGLIPFLEKASSKLQLKDIRGSTVAVDTYCWLHKGVFSCAEKLARGEDCDQYVQYCLKYIQMLLSYDIKPILVFDGQHLPAKALTEKRRRESRQQSKQRAAELLRLGRVEEARSQMRRCVDVTHEMALRLIRECRNRNVDCIVAPYEADAQMAWLNKADIAQYIITEDSDLTLFGAKKVIFKLDLNGKGLLVEADKLYLAMGCRQEQYQFDKFRRMCILSGCDYLDSLPGIGLAKACKFMLKTEQDDMRIALKKIPSYLNMSKLEVDDDYIENFMKAEATFKHMFIYNPLQRRMERLCALEEYSTDVSYCSNAGTLLEDSHLALHLALGNLNPFSLKKLDSWEPGIALPAAPKNTKRSKHKSIWLTNGQHSVNEQPEKVKSSCALFFKKVDFVGQTIDEEIQANERLEQAKQTEAQVFSMYSSKTKRRRSDSTDRERTPPPSPVQTRSRHNPFAKDPLLRSPVVCENSSLLRLLSPKKCSPVGGGAEETRVNSLKRSIFAKEQQVEVRSRFFATQAEETMLGQQPKKEEELGSSGSNKKLRLETKTNAFTDPTDVVLSEENEKPPLNASSNEASVKSLEILKSEPAASDTINLLSDDSCSSEATLPGSQEDASVQSNNFFVSNKRRVGLSKPANTTAKKPLSKSKNKFSSSSPNQPKLSMFGFQKRPVLK
ncbi:exonuclease 1 [Drosophila guanche]|uniref:exonuclease 1 n=1 Tax=Drosophila guanche TaxID=7266 RepID=UPI001470FC6F|nr:exonuclease 1 [Drosophila guanche]